MIGDRHRSGSCRIYARRMRDVRIFNTCGPPRRPYLFKSGSFDLLTAFEVIEHLTDWRGLIQEAARVLNPTGLFLVSTPNRVYYAESRRLHGPNPYHVHEFGFEEFQSELGEYFPHVAILFQNRIEAFAFHGGTQGRLPSTRPHKSTPHRTTPRTPISSLRSPPPRRFLPCSRSFTSLARPTSCANASITFNYSKRSSPRASSGWSKASPSTTPSSSRTRSRRNIWPHKIAGRWNSTDKLKAAQLRIVELQDEAVAIATGYKAKVADWKKKIAEKTAWAMDLKHA